MDAQAKAKGIVAGWHQEDPLFKNLNVLVDKIALALKEQDRDTRHACAEAIMSLPEVTVRDLDGVDVDKAVDADLASSACMNARGFDRPG